MTSAWPSFILQINSELVDSEVKVLSHVTNGYARKSAHPRRWGWDADESYSSHRRGQTQLCHNLRAHYFHSLERYGTTSGKRLSPAHNRPSRTGYTTLLATDTYLWVLWKSLVVCQRSNTGVTRRTQIKEPMRALWSLVGKCSPM